MLHIKPVPFLLLPTFLLILSTFLSFSFGDSQMCHQPTLNIHGIIDRGDGVVSWEMRKSVLDGNTVGLDENISMILASKRTHRKDPLDHFKYYNGGWNIRENHYFFSVAYTAAPLLLISVVWFVGFAVTLSVICIPHSCCQLKQYGYSRAIYGLSLILLIFSTVAVIVGSIILYTGQEKFHSSTTSTLNYVVNQADITIESLMTVSEYLSDTKGIGVDQFYLPPSVQDNINKVERRINASITSLQKETNENQNKIQDVLDSIRVTLLTVASLMLLLAFLGFIFSISGKQTFVYILAAIGWILATVSLILCCLFLILHNVVGDTCVAMDEWVQNPTAHTALDDILPCVDNVTAQDALLQSKDVTFQLVGVVNIFITNVSNINPPPILPPNLPPNIRRLFYNQSGPFVPVLCNPFNSDLTDRICAAGEVDFSNASQEWSKYICQVSTNGNCTTMGRLTPEFYKQMTSAANVGYILHHYGPFLVNLVDCTFVRETFSGISEHHCPGLNRYSERVFIGLVIVSVAVMLSLIFWVFYARERRHWEYTKQFVHQSAQNNNGEEKGV